MSTRDHLGTRLCAAWGLDPMKVSGITISVDGSGVARVAVSMWEARDADSKAERVLKEFTLEPKA